MAKDGFSINNKEFNAGLQAFIAKTKQSGKIFVVKVSLELLEAVIRRTPVGNPSIWASKRRPRGYVGGTLRNSWRVGIGAMPPSERRSADASGAASQAEAVKITAQADVGTTVFIANGQKYARRVEYGHSKQAPAGMARLSIAELRARIKRIAKEAYK